MNALRLLFPLFILLGYSSFAQTSDTLVTEQGDTLETIVSDTSIIYVIQQTPVTIRERIEILQTKEKNKYYVSLSGGVIYYDEYRKARPGYESYLTAVNALTKKLFGYTASLTLWKCNKKIYSGFGLNFRRLLEEFRYTNAKDSSSKLTNQYNSLDLTIEKGLWINKGKKFSIIPYGGIHFDYLLSATGFTLNKSNTILSQRKYEAIKYNTLLVGFSLNIKCLFTLKNSLFEIEPFLLLSPFSSTPKNEAYSIRRSMIGIKLGVINKFF